MGAALLDGIQKPDLSESPETPPPRRLGDYDLLREIARGGMGVVWLAVQRSLGRQVALKLLPTGLATDPVRLARFRAEANLAARLQHPNIVAIHEIGDDKGVPFFSMDYVPGKDLGTVARGHPMAWRTAAELVRTVALAIQYAHDQGVLHRDLKPSNVLVTAEGEPKVTDFGLAKLLDPESDLTLTGEILGSPCFMAPEQVSGRRRTAGVRTDVYGLGGILYFALTGQPPFAGESISATLQKVLHSSPIPPRTLQPGIPPEVEELVLRCLAKDPALRFPSANLLAAELERALRGQPLRVRAPGALFRLWGWARREPGIAVLGSACLLLAGGLLLSAVALANHKESTRTRTQRHRDEAATSRYIADVSLASQALADGDTRTAIRLLDGLIPGPGETDIRGFEWHLIRQKCDGNASRLLWHGNEPVTDFVLSPDHSRLILAGPASLRILPATGSFAERQHLLPGGARWRTLALDTRSGHAWIADSLGLHRIDLESGTIDSVTSTAIDIVVPDPGSARVAVGLHREGDAPDAWVLPWPSRSFITLPGAAGPWMRWRTDGSLHGIRWDGRTWTWTETDGLAFGPALQVQGGVVTVAESPDGSRRASIDQKGTLRVENLRSGRLERSESLSRTEGIRLAFSDDGNRLVEAGGGDQRVMLREAPGWGVIGRLHGHVDQIAQVRILPGDQGILTGSPDRTIRRWSWEGAEPMPQWKDLPHDPAPGEPVFSLDGEWMSVGFGPAHRISTRIWRVRDPDQAPIRLPGRTIAFSPDGSLALQATGNGRLEACRFIGRRDSVSFTINPQPGSMPDQISPDGGFFACLGADERLRVFHGSTGQHLPGPVAKVERFRISPDGRWLLFLTRQGAGLFELGSRDQQQLVMGEPTTFAFSPDSRHAFVGLASGRMVVHDLVERRTVMNVEAHPGPVRASTFMPDSRSLVTATPDGTVRFWNVPSWREISHLRLPQPVSAVVGRPGQRAFVAIGPGAMRLLGTGPDSTARPPVRTEGGFWEDPFGIGTRLSALPPQNRLPSAVLMR